MKKFFVFVVSVLIMATGGGVLAVVFFRSLPSQYQGCPALTCISTEKVEWEALQPDAWQEGGLREYAMRDTEQEGGLRRFDSVPGIIVKPRPTH